MARRPKTPLNVQSFPRPPLCERTSRHLKIKYNDHIIAESKEAFWVLETHHAPTYYLPESSIRFPLTKTSKKTYCEWKGWATYYNINIPAPPPSTSQTSTTLSGTTSTSTPSSTSTQLIKERIWGYDSPTQGFKDLKGYVAFYVGPWDCYVAGEKVVPQPGDFYGGWTTSELTGLIKGDAATSWM